jgi:hypothetical protein
MNTNEAITRLQSYAFYRTDGDLNRLEWFGSKHYSQSDEDGIIFEIFKRIGTTNKTFIEFGAETGQENNSRFLLESGWNGLWIEGNSSYIPGLLYSGAPFQSNGKLQILESYVNPDNINKLIKGSNIRGEIDFLSIDIDSIDYYVFDAITEVNPRVIALEHNSNFGPTAKYVMPLDLNYRWDHSNPDDNQNGASISSLEELAMKKNYQLVGCGLFSPNGFYVRKDLLSSKNGYDLFPYLKTTEILFNPSIYDEIINYPLDSILYPNFYERALIFLLRNRDIFYKH